MSPTKLTPTQRTLVLQRLTALWAFSESGLGGILHALQVPFTGLIVGGFAVIIITLMAHVSRPSYGEVLKSLTVVLLVKLAVSPHTSFPAYIAVSFQACLGYSLFRLFGVRLLSVMVLSVLAMLESALQKLMVLTVFFGMSWWKAADELVLAVSKQLSWTVTTGGTWIVGTYLAIYFVGGLLVGLTALKMTREMGHANAPLPDLGPAPIPTPKHRRTTGRQIALLLGISATLSLLLYLLAPRTNEAVLATARAFTWTVSAILAWYLVLAPTLLSMIRSRLQRRSGRYHQDVGLVLAFLPVLRQLAAQAWRVSRTKRGPKRIPFFLSLLVGWALTYSDPAS
ncbi:MAG: hypothetical protein JWP27_2347 [Flaviaesturariibacter sp.]|nr:hypothetical protein [Flaviaesturariibacter sp.]